MNRFENIGKITSENIQEKQNVMKFNAAQEKKTREKRAKKKPQEVINGFGNIDL